jgi:hypothetical protein
MLDACIAKKEHVMEKRSEVHAVYAESLVFESNFGRADGLTTGSGDEASKRARSIPETTYDAENTSSRGATRLLIGDQFWPGF